MQGTPTPWSFWLVRLLFKFVLKIFYGTIVVEGAEFIPKNGQPWCVRRECCCGKTCMTEAVLCSIVCANHSNSLTDAL
jgi:glycerol-3-phosphate O-acyltransferase/dihydroxyacetone phosphate acyltransferase